MHNFNELVQHCAVFTLEALEAAQKELEDELQTSAATSLVRALQMVQLQKSISAVGMFAMFDASLQGTLGSTDGFGAASKLLKGNGGAELKERFENLQLAINVLKHGRGRSYEALLVKAGSLPFRIKPSDEAFFNEGDVSEVDTLIEVNDAFVLLCAEVIHEVSEAIREAVRASN